MSATKEQERKALEKIRKIVAELGENSYIGTAFEGCFEIAEINIENDFADSWKGRADCATEREKLLRERENRLKVQYMVEHNHAKELEREVEALQKSLDAELEWKPTDSAGTTLAQTDYDELARCGKELTPIAAKELISRDFGFDSARITIITAVATYAVNKHNELRKAVTFYRKPFYSASDWNYIRFDCAGRSYEMVNGDLNNYYD